MMTDWRDEFDRAIIDRNGAIQDAIEWKARAEAAAAELRELRENVLLGLGMTAEDVATLDDDLVDPTISYLLGGYKELAVEAAALRAELDAARDALELGNLWRNAALVVGEYLASVGPTGYYDFGPVRWREWALSAIAALRARATELEAGQGGIR